MTFYSINPLIPYSYGFRLVRSGGSSRNWYRYLRNLGEARVVQFIVIEYLMPKRHVQNVVETLHLFEMVNK
ncbi:Uncharacterised protein [Chlamydia trachomatis]|nr:Uncharacterised protein [Chlamydia trachomatis]